MQAAPTEIVNRIIDRARDHGINATYWQSGGRCRIYASAGRRDTKVFLELDDPNATGAALKVQIDECGQNAKWYASQRALLQERFMPLFFAYVVERYAGAHLDGYGPDICNMIHTARAVMSEVE